jgi:GntR family transcriptional regulator / MocR family aminotransferase
MPSPSRRCWPSSSGAATTTGICAGASGSTAGIAAGLHAIVRLPARYGPPARLLHAATTAGLRIRPLSDYRVTTPDDDLALVVGYAHLPNESITAAIRTLSTLP